MTTDEVLVRITQMRDAAENLNTAAQNIARAVETTNSIVENLMSRGFVSPAATAFHTRFLNQTTVMDEWPVHVSQVATRLEEAADDIEDAAKGNSDLDDTSDGNDPSDPGHGHGDGDHGQGHDPNDDDSSQSGQTQDDHGNDDTPPGQSQDDHGNNDSSPGQSQDDHGNSGAPPPFIPSGTSSSSGTSSGTSSTSSDSEDSSSSSGTGGGHHYGNSNHESEYSAPEETEVPEAPPEEAPLEAYISGENRELYDEITTNQQEIVAEQQNLDYLQTRRQSAEAELENLTSRLEEAGANTDNARVRALRDQITQIDGQITDSQTRIADIQTRIVDIQTRLDRVRPAAGADLNLIASLEGSRTIDAILNATSQSDNSINCVNWVCNRMPIPPGIPGNAMTWIDNAVAHPEYGISVGNTPLAGSVIVMQPDHSFANDQFGHVMYVERVENGMIWVTDNNNHTPVLLNNMTDELSGPNIQYMYFPWQTRG